MWYDGREQDTDQGTGTMLKRMLVLLAVLLLTVSSAVAEGELRGYNSEEGYVYVTFGRYYQTIDGGIPDDGRQAWKWRTEHQAFKNDKANKGLKYDPGELEMEPILWRVLSVDEEKVFLCSEFILYACPLDTDRKAYKQNGSDFGQTELCRRMNGEFAETAFTGAELEMLLPRETFGKLFLLSSDEMNDKSLGFGTRKARKTWATEYAIRVTDAFVYQVSMGNHSPCWTRTQCKSKKNAGLCTKQEGDIGYYDCTNPEEGVRPAVWMKPDGCRIESGSGSREDPYVIVPAEPGEGMEQ